MKEFTKINKTSKRGQAMINDYCRSSLKQLRDAYCSYSKAKEDAFADCFKKYQKYSQNAKISEWRIFGCCINSFNFGFRINNDLIIETKKNSYLIENAF